MFFFQDQAILRLEQYNSSTCKIKHEASPGVGLFRPEILTPPPSSTRKTSHNVENSENIPDLANNI